MLDVKLLPEYFFYCDHSGGESFFLGYHFRWEICSGTRLSGFLSLTHSSVITTDSLYFIPSVTFLGLKVIFCLTLTPEAISLLTSAFKAFSRFTSARMTVLDYSSPHGRFLIHDESNHIGQPFPLLSTSFSH